MVLDFPVPFCLDPRVPRTLSALVDQARHPRFAIGESSTPIADAILDRLGQKYDIPTLRNLSCWGVGRRTTPHSLAGVKGDSVTLCINLVKSSMRKHLVIGVCLWQRAHRIIDRTLTGTARALIDSLATGRNMVWSTSRARRRGDRSFSKRSIKVVCESADPDTRGSSRFEIESDWLIDASGSSCVVSLSSCRQRQINSNKHPRLL